MPLLISTEKGAPSWTHHSLTHPEESVAGAWVALLPAERILLSPRLGPGIPPAPGIRGDDAKRRVRSRNLSAADPRHRDPLRRSQAAAPGAPHASNPPPKRAGGRDRSPPSGRIASIVFPSNSGEFAKRTATAAAAPPELPERMPSSRERRRATPVASSFGR